MTKTTKSVQGCAGVCRGVVQGKTPVPIGLCRVCRANARTCARNNLNNISIHSMHSRAHGQHPCTPLHTPAHPLFCAGYRRTHPCTDPCTPLHTCYLLIMTSEKTIKEFIKEMRDAFGDGIEAMQVKDLQGNIIKQTDNWMDEAQFIKAQKMLRARK
jgi:hypothetical protein